MQQTSRWFCILGFILLAFQGCQGAVDSPEVGIPWLYPGIAAFSFLWAAADAYGIGANDVANSFSTAVAAKTISHKTAIGIALVAEFMGALVLGSSVTDTVRKKVIDVSNFEHDPYVLMLGMGCTSLGSAIWVLLATSMQMPVSSTHATIGAIMGVGVASFGSSGVNWGYSSGGFLSIVSSWFISPCLAGCLAAMFYMTTKVLVLDHGDEKAFDRGLRSLPVFAFFTYGIIAAFMVLKGSPALALDKLPLGVTIPTIIVIALICAIIAQVYLKPWCVRVIKHGEDIPWYKMFALEKIPVTTDDVDIEMRTTRRTMQEAESSALVEATNDARGLLPDSINEGIAQRSYGALTPTGMVSIGDSFITDITNDEVDTDLMDKAPKHDSRTEGLYKVLQVSTCTFSSLAHGANDIANSIGPLATVWMVFSTGRVSSKAPVPAWILAFGAICLDIGLLTYGHHIMRALGNKLTYHSPSRGFCMELGAMFTVLLFSKLGVPVSTTHCKCGATTAVGLCSGDAGAVNWKLITIILFGWLLTLPAAGLMSGLVFYIIVNSPRPVPGNGFFGNGTLGDINDT